MTREKEGGDPDDDFGGISRGELALYLTIATLSHPWQALKELLKLLGRLGRRMFKRAITPFVVVAAIIWMRRRDRHPSFEDYLRRTNEEDHRR